MPSTSFSESVDLMGFEGAEKKMEIIFSTASNKQGLRSYGLDHWSSVVATLNGSILKNDSLEEFDSYLISESSLFVYADRVIILTCGTTTLLKSLPSILESAKNINMEMVWFQFSRKNFLYPQEQLFPVIVLCGIQMVNNLLKIMCVQHKSFDQEVKFCSEMFSDGHAHVLGPLNADHWYVFIVDRTEKDEEIKESSAQEQTLNIYMYGIPQQVAQLFMKSEEMILPAIFDTKETSAPVTEMSITKDIVCKLSQPGFTFVTSSAEATERSGIQMLMNETDGRVVHDHLFDPCGYSMNGVASKDRYWTIHITPEAHCSYISFETNYAPQSYDALVSKVMRTFQPERATVVIQGDNFSRMCADECVAGVKAGNVAGYCVSSQSVAKVANEYTVWLINYEEEARLDDTAWTCSSQSSMDSYRD